MLSVAIGCTVCTYMGNSLKSQYKLFCTLVSESFSWNAMYCLHIEDVFRILKSLYRFSSAYDGVARGPSVQKILSADPAICSPESDTSIIIYVPSKLMLKYQVLMVKQRDT